MNDSFNPHDAIDYINMSTMSTWVEIKDNNTEYKRQGKEFDPSDEECLNNILELIYDKEYKEAFVRYVDWFANAGALLEREDVILLKNYAEYLGVNAPKLNTFTTVEEAYEKGLITWPSSGSK